MNFRQSILQRAKQTVLRARLKFTAFPDTVRNRAFTEYSRGLLKVMNQPATALKVWQVEHYQEPATGKTVVRLQLQAPPDQSASSGDLLHIEWQNHPHTVKAIQQQLGPAPLHSLVIWEEGSSFCPARRISMDASSLLKCFLDLEKPSRALLQLMQKNISSVTDDIKESSLLAILKQYPAAVDWMLLARYQTRMRPRLYSLAGIRKSEDRSLWEILVSLHPNAEQQSGRASAYLSRLQPGDVIRARTLNHPHRLPSARGHDGPGLVVVTGTAIASVLAAKDTGDWPEETKVVWGVPTRAYQKWAAAAWSDCSWLHLAISRPGNGDKALRVQDVLAQQPELMDTVIRADGWFFISGHRFMETSLRKLIQERGDRLGLPPDWLSHWSDQMRYVSSTSG